MICATFALPGRVTYRGADSAAVGALSTIIAGSKFAIAILHMVLLWPMVKLLTLFPTITLSKFVDDVTMDAEGPAYQALETGM